MVEWVGKYVLAHLRDDVGGKNGESMHRVILCVWSEKLCAATQSHQLTCDPASDFGKVIVNFGD